MKTNELMRADWVSVTGAGPAQVAMIDRYHVVTTLARYLVDARKLEPIEITPEILEANGFIKSGYMCRCCHNLADFDNHAQLDYNLKFSTFEIKRMKNRAWTAKIYIDAHYVHELQHALRLADLNDMADNFIIEKGGQQ